MPAIERAASSTRIGRIGSAYAIAAPSVSLRSGACSRQVSHSSRHVIAVHFHRFLLGDSVIARFRKESIAQHDHPSDCLSEGNLPRKRIEHRRDKARRTYAITPSQFEPTNAPSLNALHPVIPIFTCSNGPLGRRSSHVHGQAGHSIATRDKRLRAASATKWP